MLLFFIKKTSLLSHHLHLHRRDTRTPRYTRGSRRRPPPRPRRRSSRRRRPRPTISHS